MIKKPRHTDSGSSPRVFTLRLRDLVVHARALRGALGDCLQGRCSHTSGPLAVIPSGEARLSPGAPEKYQLVDGHHRLVEMLLDGTHRDLGGRVRVRVDSNLGTWGTGSASSWDVARSGERWTFEPDLKFGGLENLLEGTLWELGDLEKFLRKRKKNQAREPVSRGQAQLSLLPYFRNEE